MQHELDINAVIGYKGSVPQGLILHPDNEHIIFPLGSTIVVRNVLTKTQNFLRGHDNEISCLAVSPSGKYIASGQKTYSGFQADVIVWNFEDLSIVYRFKMHKVMVQSLSFSFNEQYLASLGGEDDKSTLIVWDLPSGKSMFGAPLGQKSPVVQVKFFNTVDDKLLAVSGCNVQIISIERSQKKIQTMEVSMGNMKRQFTCFDIDSADQFAYCGTKSGDFLEINLTNAIFKRVGPVKGLFSLGVTALALLPNGDIIIGSGEGKLAKVSVQTMQTKVSTQVLGGVSSIAFTGDFTHFFCGTNQSNIYWADTDQLNAELRNTCHYSKINDVAFPYNYSDLFATCSVNDIRIWNAKNRQELLRIQVPNLECNCVAFMRDGKSIISGWNDGKIRAFYPQSGKLMYVINDAHVHGVASIASTADCQRIVSGGAEGEVRVWRIGKQTQTLEASMKEHRGRVWSIKMSNNDEQAVSASADGSCIIWDLNNFSRILAFFESTLFKQVLFHPDGSQILTTGSNRKITYWDTFDGQTIRMIDGSEDGEINTMDITAEGQHFVSGGEDKLIRIWGYDEGLCNFVGVGHSGGISKIVFSPDQKTIVSVGAEGAIFMWENPEEVQKARAESDLPTLNNKPVVETSPVTSPVKTEKGHTASKLSSPSIKGKGGFSPEKSVSAMSSKSKTKQQGKIF